MNNSTKQRAEEIYNEAHNAKAVYTAACERARVAARHRAVAEDNLAAAELALGTVAALAEQMQHTAAEKLSYIATHCLAAVFPDPYTFQIVFGTYGNKITARATFEREGHTVDPLRGAGLGACDVAVFGLRCAALALVRPPVRPLLVLDEPFKFVDEQRRPRVVELLTALAGELGVQIIMVTHVPDLRLGMVYEL